VMRNRVLEFIGFIEFIVFIEFIGLRQGGMNPAS